MSSELFIVIQTTVLVIIVSWAKAGLAAWSGWFIAGSIVVGLVGAPLLRRRETGGSTEIPWKAAAPVLVFAGIALFGLFNPFFKNLAECSAFVEKEAQEVLAKKAFSLGEDPSYIERVQREMRFFRSSVRRGNHDEALARYPEFFARWAQDPTDVAPPGGEALADQTPASQTAGITPEGITPGQFTPVD